VEAVDMVMSNAQTGQIIVKAGEKITQAQFVLIDGFGLSERGINWMGLGSTAILVTGAIWTFCLVAQRLHLASASPGFSSLGFTEFYHTDPSDRPYSLYQSGSRGFISQQFLRLNSCRHPSPLNCRSFPIQHPRYQRRFNRLGR
jgi:hypothetical protein